MKARVAIFAGGAVVGASGSAAASAGVLGPASLLSPETAVAVAVGAGIAAAIAALAAKKPEAKPVPVRVKDPRPPRG